jgi:hypothetical protein
LVHSRRFGHINEFKLTQKMCPSRRRTFGFLELEGDDGAEISRNVLVREIVGGETAEWRVRHVADVLTIGRIFTFARYPDHVQL